MRSDIIPWVIGMFPSEDQRPEERQQTGQPHFNTVSNSQVAKQGFERPCKGPPVFPGLQVDHDVALGLGATNQQIALGGRLERFGLVVDIARDQAAFASVTEVMIR